MLKKRLMRSGLARQAGVLAVMVPLSVVPRDAYAALSIVVSGTVDLNFGTITADPLVSGTVIVDVLGARVLAGGATGVTGAGLSSQGVFSLSGSTGIAIELSMAAPSFTVSNGGGGSMNVNAFNLITNGGGAAATVTLAANPTTFPLGATLNVAAAQAAGTYSGVFTVNANYQ